MEKVWIVTGGAGFIGANFVLKARQQKWAKIVTLDKLTYAGNLDSLKSLTADKEHVFVEGDNWRKSFDSNDFGTIPINLICGRPVLRADSLWKLITSRGQAIPVRNQRRGMSWTTIAEADAKAATDEWESFNYDQ